MSATQRDWQRYAIRSMGEAINLAADDEPGSAINELEGAIEHLRRAIRARDAEAAKVRKIAVQPIAVNLAFERATRP
jgi:hypothetical protein